MTVTAGIAVENTVYHFDKIFDYIVPAELLKKANIGCRVMVPFGRGNRKKQGIILSLSQNEQCANNLKSIDVVLDDTPVLTQELAGLVFFMKERYYCTYYDCVKAMLPVGINYKLTETYMPASSGAIKSNVLTEEEQAVLSYLAKRKKPVKKDILLAAMGYTRENNVADAMVKKGVLIKGDDLSRKVQDASVKMVRLCTDTPETKLTPKQTEVVEILRMVGSVSVKELCYFSGTTQAVADALVKKGVCAYFTEEVFRNPTQQLPSRDDQAIVLTAQQQLAYEDLIQKYKGGKANVSLLYGVTGSGKTSVFMKLIDNVYGEGKGVIVMVPEIALTPQIIHLFQCRYGEEVAVFHSGLSLGERLDEWKRVKNGQARIAIGTRSAVFAPFKTLGLVIMDEEQEYTYKSESTPRYHARDVAKYRCNAHNCLLLLSSATPSVDSFYQTKAGKYTINTLNERYGSATLPQVVVADMNIEQEQGNTTGISAVLMQGLEENLKQGRQSILLLNRRGHNTFVSCRNCKEVVACPHCSISLTYHSANNRLMCHYCGYSQNITDECPACHSTGLRFTGMGTQMAEQTLTELLPNAGILRLDTDATMSKYSLEKKLKKFADGEYDIMVGTQMVAKGLDFSNVTLVGVLSIDQMLYTEDYRSYERTFSLLTQVVGRSGRGEHAGRAIIQTFTPENPTILLAARQDYEGFYQGEIAMRKAMLYPPFADLCMVGFVGEKEEKVHRAADAFTRQFISLAQTQYSTIPLRVLGASAASITKINNKYRYKMVLKCRNTKTFRNLLSALLREFGANRTYSDVTVYADMNPDTII